MGLGLPRFKDTGKVIFKDSNMQRINLYFNYHNPCFKATIFFILSIAYLHVQADFNNSSITSEHTGTYQFKRLFHPSQYDLKHESLGQVFIYDGLFDNQVDQAMEQEFARIEHMMFVQTKSVQPSGEVVEDNDCD